MSVFVLSDFRRWAIVAHTILFHLQFWPFFILSNKRAHLFPIRVPSPAHTLSRGPLCNGACSFIPRVCCAGSVVLLVLFLVCTVSSCAFLFFLVVVKGRVLWLLNVQGLNVILSGGFIFPFASLWGDHFPCMVTCSSLSRLCFIVVDGL